MITDFYRKTTKAFNVYCYINNTLQNIEFDTVSIVFKNRKDDSDEDAILTKDAIINESVAEFTLTKEETDIDERNYYCEIKWTLVTGEVYILYSDSVRVLERVYD